MHTLTFYPLGNADGTCIDLADGRQMLVDFGNQATGEPGDRRMDLATALREDLDARGRREYAVVVFTHLDKDHYQGASSFFHLEHSPSHQGSDRVTIRELWVPAGVLTEEDLADEEAMLIQAEARHRLEKGEGIRVFSRPERLASWLATKGLTVEARKHLFTDAGTTVPGYALDGPEAVEFFIHSPHATRINADEVEDRNGHCLVFQARFRDGAVDTDVLFSGDSKHETWKDIVEITRKKGRDEAPHSRLRWDVYKLPHHCSYTAIGPEKASENSPDKTPPTTEVRTLCEDRGADRCIVISPSKPIPTKGTDEDDDKQPPHREAANYYRNDVVAPRDGRFLVTMEHPERAAQPTPIIVDIGVRGATHRLAAAGIGAGAAGAAGMTGASSPRAGQGDSKQSSG